MREFAEYLPWLNHIYAHIKKLNLMAVLPKTKEKKVNFNKNKNRLIKNKGAIKMFNKIIINFNN